MGGEGGRAGGSPPGGGAAAGAVLLQDVPLGLFLRLGRHVDELSRELEILTAGVPDPAPGVEPLRSAFHRLVELSDRHRRSALERAEVAAADGLERIDLPLRLPPGAVRVVHELVGVLEQADELSRHDELLTMAPPEEVVALRRWIAAEVESQLAGGDPPRPCPL